MTPAENKLRADAASAGVQILDLRGWPRDITYPARHHCVTRGAATLSVAKAESGDIDFGPWGYFRTRRGGKAVFAETPPTRGARHGVSSWASKPCTVLHTTAVPMHAARFIGVPVQHGIAKDGTIVLCHELRSYCHHADGANRYADGVEISGRSTISAAQVVSARLLLRYIDAEKREHGVARQYVAPHAFSQDEKPNDCGAAIWRALGEWAMAELGWSLGPLLSTGVQPAWAPGVPASLASIRGASQ